jgi:glutamate racemase
MSIGVFDSGVGGLSVHRALVERLPRADFLYLADQAYAPYGGRPGEEIVELTRQGAVLLFEAGVDLVVLACNTASAHALRRLQQTWLPDYRAHLGRPINLLGLIVPTIEAATGRDWLALEPALEAPAETIAVFSTPGTVDSQVYEIEIHKRRPGLRVVSEPCPRLARLIEAGAPAEALAADIRLHVAAMLERAGGTPERAVLGCTHYELVADLFAQALPQATAMIHQPAATANALERYLARHPEYRQGDSGARRFLTTGAPGKQNALVEAFWGAPLSFEGV